jgi:hypothetical protein
MYILNPTYTILKINKLGVWNKSLQKGLTTYVADTYDDEREFMELLGDGLYELGVKFEQLKDIYLTYE